jgi:hypothetical protein
LTLERRGERDDAGRIADLEAHPGVGDPAQDVAGRGEECLETVSRLDGHIRVAQVGDELAHDRQHKVGRIGVVKVERVVRIEEADEIALSFGKRLKRLLQAAQLGRLAAPRADP